jgi:putative inorganic carbon (HCO3(-)) transporter
MKRLDLKGREIIDLLIEFSYLAIIFIVPIFFAAIYQTYNIFELNKLFIFKIFVWLLFSLTAVKLIFYRVKWPLKKHWLIPGIFIISLGISLFFSLNPQQSFFGSYDRQAGYLSFLFYFFWFVLVVFNILTIDNRSSRKSPADNLEKKINRIIITAVISSFLVALYGILQIFGIDFFSWPEDPLITRRTLSTFGQPNFLASWLLLVIPLSAYLIYQNKKFLFKFFYFLILSAQIVCLFFTSSRGGFVALGIAGLLFVIYLIFFSKLNKHYKFLAGLGLAILLISGVVGLNIFLPGRFTGLLNFQSGSSAARVDFYQASADAITKRPFFGYGLENSGEIFINYYQPNWGINGDVGSTTDKAHNLILDIVLATGFFGLIFYIILYYYFFRLAGDNIRQKKMGNLSLALALGGASYLFSLMFSFSIIAGEIYFWLYLALLAAINLDQGDIKELPPRIFKKEPILIKSLLILFIVSVSSWGGYYEVRVLTADYYFSKLYYTLAEEQYFTTFVLADHITAQNTNPINQEYYNRFLGDKLSDFYPQIKDLSSKKVVLEKIAELDKEIPEKGYENILVKGKMNSVLGNYILAEKYFFEVTNKTPYWPKTYLELGNLFFKEGKIKEAIINYQLLEKILPDVNDSRLNDGHRKILKLYWKVITQKLGDIYFKDGNYIEAEKNYQLAYLNDVNDFTLLKNIADTYYLRGDFAKALEYNLRGLERNPEDYSWYLSTALIYKKMGNIDEAKNYFNSALKLAPTNEVLLRLKPEY